jgi:hypothetical protein
MSRIANLQGKQKELPFVENSSSQGFVQEKKTKILLNDTPNPTRLLLFPFVQQVFPQIPRQKKKQTHTRSIIKSIN